MEHLLSDHTGTLTHKNHNQYLTEFGLIIRLVYLWFSTADWLLSGSEGVFPPQKQSRHGFRDAHWKPPAINPSHEAGSINRTSFLFDALMEDKNHRLYSPCGRLHPVRATDQASVCHRVMSDWKWVHCTVDTGCEPINQGRIWIFPRLGQSYEREGGCLRDAKPVKVSTLLFRGKI